MKKYLLFPLFIVSSFSQSDVLFEEHFDNQPDWHSAMHSTDRIQRDNIPSGWYSIRQDPVWAPSTGHPDKHETIEILSKNAAWARGGVGKSMVSWRDSYEQNSYWGSESILLKYFPEGYNEIYVEFWIRFGDNWSRGDTGALSKLFRISSWSEDLNSSFDEYGFGGGRENGPVVLWDHTVNSYGLRNTIALRAGPHGDNYGFKEGDILDLPRSLITGSSGDLTLGYTGNPNGNEENGNNPNLPDRVNGGVLNTDRYASETHDQIFGAGASWTKMAFYVKMNSAPDVKDGVFRQWLNGQPIVHIKTIPWIKASSTENEKAKWNIVAIGGNDYFREYPNSERVEEWYSIDDVVVHDSIPLELMPAEVSPPLPPSRINSRVN